jgi:hypothetical protein
MAVQALLFKKDKWDIKGCKTYLSINKIRYISYRTTANYYRFRLIEPNYNKYHYIIKRGNNHIDYIIQLKK